MFLKNNDVTFKETFYLLQDSVMKTIWFSWMFDPICASSPFCTQAI